MQKTRFLMIKFDRPIQSWELRFFRSSVIENTKRKSDLFHNHKSNTEVIYRYPLVQYKIIDRKPAIICINAATEDIRYLLENEEYFFDIKGRVEKYEIEEIMMKNFILRPENRTYRYHIHNYMPFNQENYAIFKKLGSLKRQIQFTEEMLNKHVNILAEALGIDIHNNPIQSKILQIRSDKHIEYKKVFHLTYCLNFECNLSLPSFISLGKGTTVGFGSIKQIGNHDT